MIPSTQWTGGASYLCLKRGVLGKVRQGVLGGVVMLRNRCSGEREASFTHYAQESLGEQSSMVLHIVKAQELYVVSCQSSGKRGLTLVTP